MDINTLSNPMKFKQSRNWMGTLHGSADTELRAKSEKIEMKSSSSNLKLKFNLKLPPLNSLECYYNFDDLQLKESLLRGIYTNGYEKPTAIQQRAIMPSIRGRDVIMQVHDGSGKTISFAIAILQQIDEAASSFSSASLSSIHGVNEECEAIVLAPTKSQVLHIQSVFMALSAYMDINRSKRFSRTSDDDDDDGDDDDGEDDEENRIRVSKESPICRRIIVDTPGHLCNFLLNGFLSGSSNVKMIVLSQADEMLAMGLKPKIQFILKALPSNAQMILSTTAMPPDLLDLSQSYMHHPVHIELKRNELSLDAKCVRQYFVNVRREEFKLSTLCDLYDTLSISQSVIFCNQRSRVLELKQNMTCNHFTVATISNNMERHVRDEIVKHFRLGSYRVLIATDLMARQIDVQQCGLIINYDLPLNGGDYIYRIGRSERCCGFRKSLAINIVTDETLPMLRDIEQLFHTTIEEMPENIAEIL